MSNELFIAGLGLGLLLVFRWAFHHLPGEKWQILAVLPRQKTDEHHWQGLNLTFYGFFIAAAYTFALALLLVLVHSAGLNGWGVSLIMLGMLALCLPAARLIARRVENKPGTFTVAGAAFAGLVMLPLLVWLVNQTLGHWLNFDIPLLIMLAAVSTAYAFGESIGRLACISFGCCYGKPLENSPALFRTLFKKRHFVFWGPTKKAAYASNLEGRPVVPIQALTAIIYALGGLLGSYLFLKGYYVAAAVLTLSITQGWRLVSEIWREDYRGGQRFSAYQKMALAALLYMLPLLAWNAAPDIQPLSVSEGLTVLWEPEAIIALQLVWLTVFLYTGRSQVTGSRLEIFVNQGQV